MRRFWVALFAFTFVCSTFVSSSLAAGNPRYAALVMDAETGKILFESHAREKRYPASLTKMMTLYMVFEALEKGTWTLDKKLTASKKAASQPQTNIALRVGDKLTVEQAIKALVTRSANDAALVLAESLGKTDWNFGVMMTNKARSLGMKNTVFRNPHGLPDSRQYTTAYDMALLGIALRRDFPQYYHFFTTRSFTYKGRTYGSHNRVLDRYPGVDGIKTGYINASGFNLVSSVKRDGVTMVAVVMGGITGASRDNHMVTLLKKHFPTLVAMKKQGTAGTAYAQATTQAANLNAGVANPSDAPAPQLKPSTSGPQASIALAQPASQATRNALSAEALDERVLASAENRPAPRAAFAYKSVAPAATPDASEPALAPKAGSPVVRVAYTPPAAARSQTLDYQYAKLEPNVAPDQSNASMRGIQGEWGIQVGAFRSESQAREAIAKAMQMVEDELKHAYMNITSEGEQQAAIHRARLGNLSKTEAESACRKLNAMNAACFPLRIN